MIYTPYGNLALGYKTSAPRNVPLWAFAYSIDDDTNRSKLRCTPVRGIIIPKDKHGYDIPTFHPFKKNTTEPLKNGVSSIARYYADTYEEAVFGYNKLVEKRITKLQGLIDETKKDLIQGET